jgi:cell division initiation protein
MFTPQQIEQISFSRATFGGYDMQAVDEFLEPLTEDYITLYKENALLKSKMKVLVTKLEEYRANEESMKQAIADTQANCDAMIKSAEEKCTKMLEDAGCEAEEKKKNADALVAAEEARVEEARQVAFKRIEELKSAVNACVAALEQIQQNNMPAEIPAMAYDYDLAETTMKDRDDEVANEISASLKALVGAEEETVAGIEPLHPNSATGKFANLQFGPNYGNSQR